MIDSQQHKQNEVDTRIVCRLKVSLNTLPGSRLYRLRKHLNLEKKIIMFMSHTTFGNVLTLWKCTTKFKLLFYISEIFSGKYLGRELQDAEL